MKKAAARTAGRSQIRHHLDYARRISGLFGRARHLVQRRLVCRRNDASAFMNSVMRIARQPKRNWTRMQTLVRQSMEEGALGVGSSLIYAPAFYAKTDELIALCKAAADYGGMYISHIRSEGNRLLEAADELIAISKAANIPAEFYHLKAAGKSNWNKEDALLKKIEDARAARPAHHRGHVQLCRRRDRTRRRRCRPGCRKVAWTNGSSGLKDPAIR